jgi:hypothetical protein
MSQNFAPKNKEPGVGRTIWQDMRRGNLRKNVRREYADLKRHFLTDERKRRLEEMGRIRRSLAITYWLFKTLILKLSPTRRLLLLIGIVLLPFLVEVTTDSGTTRLGYHRIIGLGLILFVLMLELKDKLLARDELEAGRSVQQALLPPETVPIPGWEVWMHSESAREVGGDLVDLLEISPQRFALILADVSGKGLGAALFTAQIQAIIRGLAPDYTDLSQFARKLNEIFYRVSLPNRFASLIYLELIPNSGNLQLLNAGHMPPLRIHDGAVQELPKGNPALGLMPHLSFQPKEIRLQPGDTLVIYSDGLTEARNEQGEFFGEDALREILKKHAHRSAREMGEQIIHQLAEFRKETPAFDDTSLIILKRQG